MWEVLDKLITIQYFAFSDQRAHTGPTIVWYAFYCYSSFSVKQSQLPLHISMKLKKNTKSYPVPKGQIHCIESYGNLKSDPYQSLSSI